jgi:anti-sigma factor RsiW
MKTDHITDEELQQLLDGQCTADEVQSARAHMAVCSACSRQYAQYVQLDEGLRGAVPATITDSVVRSISTQLQTDRYLRALTRVAAVVGPMVAVLFLAAIALTIYFLVSSTGEEALASSRSTPVGEWFTTTTHQAEQLLSKGGDVISTVFRPTAFSTLWMILVSIAAVFLIDSALTRRRKPQARM